ncbi:MAG: hypothetical protein FWE72_01550 [Spirochaetaceae bacterium]|nr:hypothetical protein [Spirochaetaceae bacterium]
MDNIQWDSSIFEKGFKDTYGHLAIEEQKKIADEFNAAWRNVSDNLTKELEGIEYELEQEDRYNSNTKKSNDRTNKEKNNKDCRYDG